MTRLATAVDRIAALAIGLALIAFGGGLLVWRTGWIPGFPAAITAPGLVAASGTHWWPWAVAGTGLLLVVLALRWLLAHTPRARSKQEVVTSGPYGMVSADLGQVADAAARALASCPEAHSATGKAVLDRGEHVIDLTVTALAPATVSALIDAVDHVAPQLAHVLGDTSLAVRTSIHVDRRTRRVVT